MIVTFLGTAAGGGVPQWNCGCPTCETARLTQRHRTQDSIAVSGDGSAWYLVNASPDIRAQVLACPRLRPLGGTRDTPIRGLMFSTAELDHTLGLLSLREADSIDVYASQTVLDALAGPFPLRHMLAPYARVSWHPLVEGEPMRIDGGLVVRRVTVAAKRPRYAAAADGAEWVSALEISDSSSGGRLIYATCLPAWSDVVADLVAGATCAILDGTFATDDELTRLTGRPVSARAMGHLPIAESWPLAQRVATVRVLYSHLNNTNPLAVSTGHGLPRTAFDGISLSL